MDVFVWTRGRPVLMGGCSDGKGSAGVGAVLKHHTYLEWQVYHVVDGDGAKALVFLPAAQACIVLTRDMVCVRVHLVVCLEDYCNMLGACLGRGW